MTTDIKVGDEVVAKKGLSIIGKIGYISSIPDFGHGYYNVLIPGVGKFPLMRSEFRLKNDPEERRFLDALDMINVKTGSPGLTSWSDGKVGMALSEFERLASLLPEAKTGPFERGETVYFTGYKESVVTERFTPGDAVTIHEVGVSGVLGAARSGTSQWLYKSEISRTKP